MGAPSWCEASRSRRARNTGSERNTRPTWAGTPALATVAASAWAPARSGASGFSQNTAQPRAAAASTTAPCAAVGVHTHTASQRSSTAAALGTTSAPFTAANPSARSSSRSWTATTAASTTPAWIMACKPTARARASTPVPTNPDLTTVLPTSLPMMDRDELLAGGDHNLASTMRLYATTAPGAMLEDDGRLLLYSTSSTWPGPYHNGAMRLDRSLAPDEVLRRAAAFFAPRPGYCVWIAAHADADLEQTALEAGYASISAVGAPRLAIEHRLDPAVVPTGVVLAEVTDDEARLDYLALTVDAFV